MFRQSLKRLYRIRKHKPKKKKNVFVKNNVNLVKYIMTKIK